MKYDQGWQENRRHPRGHLRTRRELLEDMKEVLILSFLAYVLILGLLGGCAGTRLAVEQPLQELRGAQTIRGMVRVAQMGSDCTEQKEFIEQTVRGLLIADGLPAPSIMTVRSAPGSSLCGVRTWDAYEISSPGVARAYGAAEAEVVAYWQAITRSEIRRAEKMFASLSPR